MTWNELIIQYWWIALIAIGAIIGIGTFLHTKKNKKSAAKPILNRSEYFAALGGEENFISAERQGSRIVVLLHDYSKIDKEKIKEAGVAGFIEKSDKLTLVVKDNAEEVYEKIFKA